MEEIRNKYIEVWKKKV